MNWEWHNSEDTRVFHLGLAQDWLEWFTPGWNWRNFTLIQATFELDHILGGFEISLGLVGFRMWFDTYDCSEGSAIDDMQVMVEQYKEGEAGAEPLFESA